MVLEEVTGLILLIVLLVGGVWLQIFLSKRENKWPGLILPAINIMFSILGVLGMAFYAYQSAGEVITQIIMLGIMLNIPTIILIAIYFACREKFKKGKEIDKMNIQDLE